MPVLKKEAAGVEKKCPTQARVNPVPTGMQGPFVGAKRREKLLALDSDRFRDSPATTYTMPV